MPRSYRLDTLLTGQVISSHTDYMKLLSIKQAAMEYGVSEKTIRRVIQRGKLRIKKRKKKTSKIEIYKTSLDTVYGHDTDVSKPMSKGSRSDENIKEVLRVLTDQIKEKDKQLERLDKKLDQQQQLTAGIQKQLLMLQEPLDSGDDSATKKNRKRKSWLRRVFGL